MQSFDEKEEVFFDTADYLSSEESVVAKKDLGSTDLGYDIWISEPQSVKERRESFIRDMGFLESKEEESENVALDRMRVCSGAVSSSCECSIDNVENSMDCSMRELNREGNFMADKLDQDNDANFKNRKIGAYVDEDENVVMDKKKTMFLWKSLKSKIKRNHCKDELKAMKPITETPKASRLRVRQNKKKCMEFSAVYVGQELHAHEGLIWTMKFSPDGQYLASGGEDGIVRIWQVKAACTSCKKLVHADCNSQGKKSSDASVIIPDTDFEMEELPLQVFHDHTSDILDLAWSNSNCLLSSSKDKTVRLWQVGNEECLGVFHHNNYVTCTQFNPVDEDYFISGSIDGKVRIWGVKERRVVDWADARDVITAICYQPNGKRFAVGSISGTCRFYEASGRDLLLNAKIHIQGKNKRSGNRITGIQFTEEDSQKVMITSEDSKIRIFDGVDVVHKYKGISKSGSQMSASFTSTGRHIISVGEDSHIYVWNYDDTCVPSKHPRSVRSCEHFFYEGVSIAIPWLGRATAQKGNFGTTCPRCCLPRQDHQETSQCTGDSERFSLANWLFMEGSFRNNTTWPEEKLPLWDLPAAENHHNISDNPGVLSATWGLVIVTAGSDGMIRTFHNYGLPIRK